MALAGDRLCVVSQESSALWVGRLARSAWRVVDDGAVYRFPRDDDGKVVYCNVEGVAWLSDTQVVVVSDKTKPGAEAALPVQGPVDPRVRDFPRCRVSYRASLSAW